jgi:hypothetical protein
MILWYPYGLVKVIQKQTEARCWNWTSLITDGLHLKEEQRYYTIGVAYKYFLKKKVHNCRCAWTRAIYSQLAWLLALPIQVWIIL